MHLVTASRGNVALFGPTLVNPRDRVVIAGCVWMVGSDVVRGLLGRLLMKMEGSVAKLKT